MYILHTTYPDGQSDVSMLFSGNFDCKLIRGVEIAEALATVTKAEDLADAFAWFETVYLSDKAQGMLQEIRSRASSVHGDTMLQGSVPDTSHALNNEAACRIFFVLRLEFDVRLTGLRGAAHLNGRRGTYHSRSGTWKLRTLESSAY